MSPEYKPPTYDPGVSRLRGSILRRAAAPEPVVSRVKYRGTHPGAETSHESASAELIPEDYDMPEIAVEQVMRRRGNPSLTPFDDSEGLIAPGMLLNSLADPTKRRLVTHMYIAPRGNRIVAMHIEGEPGIRNTSLERLHTALAEGALRLPEPPESE